jgi:hypothetical protein
MDNRFVVGAVVLIIFVSMWAAAMVPSTTEHRMALAEWEARVKPADSVNTLFVAVVAHGGDEADAARALFTAFSRAAAPHRVFVGVVQYSPPTDGSPLDRYFGMMRCTLKPRNRFG